MPLPDDSTLPPQSLSHSGIGLGVSETPALVLVWSRDEPHRAGEVLLIPPQDRGAWTFGRDDGKSSPRALHLLRQRPGVNEPAGPVSSPRISRTQIELRPEAGGISVKNVGRSPMLHGGREALSADLRPGDVIELRHEMVFLYAMRPQLLPPCDGVPLHPFGWPDALGFTGEGPVMWDLRRAVSAVARRQAHALVLGESGTGKELVARAIHACSPRASRPFVARSAATLPEGVLDAELFGSARGFPNTGSPERPGLVGEADGGTLFLDEIGELPESLQAHLLRVLDGGEYHRLGESRARRADLRLVAATNRPVSALKHDVLARLAARIHVPGLGARREDIPLLVHHLLRKQAVSYPDLTARLFPRGDLEAVPRVAPELLRELVTHDYTTHLRELDALLLAATLEGKGRYAGITGEVRRLLSTARATAPREEFASEGCPPPAALWASAPPKSAASRPQGGDPKGALDSPQPCSEQPLSAGTFTPDEERRLLLLRVHGFRPAACAKDPRYGANRQSADFHLRHLMARALGIRGYRVFAAEELLAGTDPLLRERIHERMTAFLDHLQERLREVGREALSCSLAAEWRGAAKVALELLAALAEGDVRR